LSFQVPCGEVTSVSGIGLSADTSAHKSVFKGPSQETENRNVETPRSYTVQFEYWIMWNASEDWNRETWKSQYEESQKMSQSEPIYRETKSPIRMSQEFERTRQWEATETGEQTSGPTESMTPRPVQRRQRPQASEHENQQCDEVQITQSNGESTEQIVAPRRRGDDGKRQTYTPVRHGIKLESDRGEIRWGGSPILERRGWMGTRNSERALPIREGMPLRKGPEDYWRMRTEKRKLRRKTAA
jgi:hypothetical protein